MKTIKLTEDEKEFISLYKNCVKMMNTFENKNYYLEISKYKTGYKIAITVDGSETKYIAETKNISGKKLSFHKCYTRYEKNSKIIEIKDFMDNTIN